MKKTPLKRKTRLRPVSKKRAKDMREYSRLRKDFLEAHPVCGVWLHENGWIDRGVTMGFFRWYEKPPILAIYPAEHLLAIGAPASTEIHHRARRGRNLLNVDTWIAVCRSGHERIHGNPSWARKNGLLD